MNNLFKSILLLILISGCASHKSQIDDEGWNGTLDASNNNKKLEKRILLIGDAGNAEIDSTTLGLKALSSFIAENNSDKDHLLFLGDNIYEKGFPSKSNETYALAKHRLRVQLEVANQFKGKTIFIPGNHDWYSGIKGLKRQEDYVEEILRDSDAFQPENGCPFKRVKLTDEVELFVLDTEWYITDWDKHPTINDNCDIKSRNALFIEIESELKKRNEKTIILALHHPALTNGPHGGEYSLNKHIFPFQKPIPLPVFGSLIAQLRSQGGVSPQDRYNKRYDELMDRLITLSRSSDRVIFVSGHEHALQYIEALGIKQIVSGSGSKTNAVALGGGAKFVYGGQGFAVLEVYKDASSKVFFYDGSSGKPELLYSADVHNAKEEYDVSKLPKQFDKEITTTVYDTSRTNKGKSYTWFWGAHYRNIYGTQFKVPVATLDTLYGGFTIERKGGGHQTRSLRLVDSKGRYFALRAVKKSAVQFLQTVAFRDTYVKEDFKGTVTEDLLFDFYTSSHPFMSLIMSDLSDAIGVYHTNPFLFYMPKHKALGKYNKEYGDELYILEERPDDDFLDVASFGKPDAIENTLDVYKKIRKDEKYNIDQSALIRARLFDMILGDWDRHQDQWRWSRFDIKKDSLVYRPIPRDRDQVFSNYDGFLIDVVKIIIGDARQFQEYDYDIKQTEWLNHAGMKMDRAFLQTSNREAWLKQAQYIKNKLNEEVIDKAFLNLPNEFQNDTLETIKSKFLHRIETIETIANEYYDFLSDLIVLTGTDKDDYIEIERKDKITEIRISRIKKGKIQAPFKERTIIHDETKEVWVYGLDDDDQIKIIGESKKPVKIRVIGGQNNDEYTIENGKKIKIYDHKNRPNTIVKNNGAKIKLTDYYSYNTYDESRYLKHKNSILPSIGSNPDDGIRLGVVNNLTFKGFKFKPYGSRHSVKAAYYFATQGFIISYDADFVETFGKWNFIYGGEYASENFSQNFFGFGNETINPEDDLGLDYNRVKTGIVKGGLGVVKHNEYGSKYQFTGHITSTNVIKSEGRFLEDFFQDNPEYFEDRKNYAALEFKYQYASYDNEVNPTRGMLFEVVTGYESDVQTIKNSYGYLNPRIVFYNALTRNKKLVFKSKVQSQINIGDNYQFFQAAEIGGDSGLRGYRNQRFSGKTALAFNADLRYSFKRVKTGLVPLQFGIYSGYDIGRVWIKEENSKIWHDDIGLGFWLNFVDAIAGQVGVFVGDDGPRVSFGFGASL